jgi:hypothetical protein
VSRVHASTDARLASPNAMARLLQFAIEARARVIVNRACWIISGALLAVHFFVVMSHSVNVPFWDDWEVLKPGALDAHLNWSWLIGFHNAHRNLLTHLTIWLLYRLGGWNLNAHIALNFFVYVVLAVTFLRFLERTFDVGMGAMAMFPASAIASESHIHAYNGSWTFFLLGFFLSVRLALRRDRWAWLAPLAAVIACYSMFGGMVCTFFFIALSVALATMRPDLRARHLAHAAIATVLLALWFVGYSGEPVGLTLPWQKDFWLFLVNLVALGFGYARVNAIPGIIYLTLTLGLLGTVWFRWRAAGAEEAERWTALSCLLGGLLACLASIGVGRGWGGPDKSGRYGEVALFVVPLTWVLLRTALRRLRSRPRLEMAGLVVLTIAMLIPVHTFLRYRHIYGKEGARRMAGLRCLHEHYYRGGPAYCPDIYYDPDTALLVEDRAVALGVSFVEEHSPLTL